MRIRLTASDQARGLRSDLVLNCGGDEPVDEIVDRIRHVFPAAGPVWVNGVEPAGTMAVGGSPLRDGALLTFGAPPPSSAPDDPDRLLLRVLSGPSAGSELAIAPGRVTTVGRDADRDLVVADPDVTRRHLEVSAGAGGLTLVDTGSLNGLWVEGKKVQRAVLNHGDEFQIGGSRIAVARAANRVMLLTQLADTPRRLVNRQVRNPPRYQPQTVALPTPTRPEEKRPFPWVGLVLPVVVAVVLAAVMRQWYYLLIAALGPVNVLANVFTDRKRQRRTASENAKDYEGQLRDSRRLIESAVDAEDAYLRARWPGVETVVRTAVTPTLELWERQPDDDDFLNLRLGFHDRPATVTVNGKRPERWTDPTIVKAPAGVNLEEVHALGLAGEASAGLGSLCWILLQAAALHSPTELRLAICAPEAREEELGWLRWLPHLSEADGGCLAAWTDEAVEGLLKQLANLTEERLRHLHQQRDARILPRYLVVLMGIGRLKKRAAVMELLARGPAAGLFFLCVDEEERAIPQQCRAKLVLNGEDSTLIVTGGATLRLRGDSVDGPTVERAARVLAGLQVLGGQDAGGLPGRVLYSDLAAVSDAETIRAAWRLTGSRTEVVVGHDGDGRYTLDLVANGPHALVAGMTRSGKSELLQTWITALCLANSPEDLNFLLIDFKGDSTFMELRHLPHVVATMTNLDGALAKRAIDSLSAELLRRQQQLKDAGVADMPDYLRLRATRPELPPFPRLFVVVDEFAALRRLLPDAPEELIQVGNTGASLGVNLILALQHPRGEVSSKLEANIGLRICLRVASEEASREVVGIPDAFRIPYWQPGRAFVQVGGAGPRLIQSARIRAKHGKQAARVVVNAVRWNEQPPVVEEKETDSPLDTDLAYAIEQITVASGGRRAPYPVVLEVLPEAMPLGEMLARHAVPQGGPRLVVGLRDLLAEQRQELLTVELGTGSLAVMGSGRSGRSNALRVFAAGLAERYTPDEVQVHVIDGAGALAGLSRLPHCGVYCEADDSERVDRLIARLGEEIRSRRSLLKRHGAMGINELAPADRPAHLVVLVDGPQAYIDPQSQALRDDLRRLVADGLSRGLTFCVAGDSGLGRGNALKEFGHTLVLRLNNSQDGGNIGLESSGQQKAVTDLKPGRGLWKDGTWVQVPLLDLPAEGTAQTKALTALADRLSRTVPAPSRIIRLDPLPDELPLDEALGLGGGPRPGHVLLGVTGDILDGLWADLSENPRLAVAGAARSGRTTAAVGLAASLACQGEAVLLAAPKLNDRHRAAERAGVTVATAAEAASLPLEDYRLIIVDDADKVQDEAWLKALAANRNQALAITAYLDSFVMGGTIPALGKAASATILLCPVERLSARNLGVSLPAAKVEGPRGRAVLGVGGESHLGQVASVDDV